MSTSRFALPFLASLALTALACSPPPPPPKPPPKVAPPPLPQLTGAQIETIGDIEFDTGASTLRDSKKSDEVLHAVAKILKDTPRFTKIRVEGHTDSDGSAASNQSLSELRAAAV